MRQLLQGLRVFQHQVFPGWRSQFEELAKGQAPSTLFITCSDSRIVPELVTQTSPGDMFVLRNAGNLVPIYGEAESSGEAATIEYAVKVLNVREIVVCGHSHCGAMKGLLNPDSTEQLPAVRQWLSHARSTLEEVANLPLDGDGSDAADDLLTTAVKCNVIVQLAHLRTYPAVAEAEARGNLELHGWFYRFETGDTFELDGASRQFVSVSEKFFEDEIPVV
jgi:carbonic anhydrase